MNGEERIAPLDVSNRDEVGVSPEHSCLRELFKI